MGGAYPQHVGGATFATSVRRFSLAFHQQNALAGERDQARSINAFGAVRRTLMKTALGGVADVLLQWLGRIWTLQLAWSQHS